MGRSRAKGTAAETAVVGALQRLGWPHAERRALSGKLDKGDISGVIDVCFEVKDAKSWTMAQWLRETADEQINARADYGILVIKVPGVGAQNAEKWLAVMDYDEGYDLWTAANKPDQRSVKLGAVGVHKALAELVERERHCGSTPVVVNVRRQRLPFTPAAAPNTYYSIMRLDARCKLLIDAGYGGHAIMDATTSSIVKENGHE